MKEYVLANELVFADSPEADIPDQDDRFTRILNNSFALSEEQFGILAAIATGQVNTDSADGIEIPTADYPGCYFLFQAGHRGKEKSEPPRRDHMIAAVVNPTTKKMRRIFIRAPQGNAEALEKLLNYFRPHHFINTVMGLLEGGGAIVATERRPRPPYKGKPSENRGNRGDRQNRQRNDGPHPTMAEKWPGRESRGRKHGGGKDRRYTQE